jgi:secretion/DNA translocation related TadE-like protein
MAIIWALALAQVILVVGALGTVIALRVEQRMRAGSVADVAALAAAQAAADPCGVAGAVAAGNAARLTGCRSEGPDVLVTVELAADPVVNRVLALLGQEPQPVTASARAGPP